MSVQAPTRPAASTASRKRPARKPRPDPILSEAQALALKRSDDAVTRARKALEAAEEERGVLRKAYRPLIPMAADDADRGKGVREITILGGKIRVTPAVSGKTFSLSKYLAAGNRITKTMAQFVGGEKPYDCWTVDLDA